MARPGRANAREEEVPAQEGIGYLCIPSKIPSSTDIMPPEEHCTVKEAVTRGVAAQSRCGQRRRTVSAPAAWDDFRTFRRPAWADRTLESVVDHMILGKLGRMGAQPFLIPPAYPAAGSAASGDDGWPPVG